MRRSAPELAAAAIFAQLDFLPVSDERRCYQNSSLAANLHQWCRRRGARGATAPPLLKVGGTAPPILRNDCTLKFNEEKISSFSMSATVAT